MSEQTIQVGIIRTSSIGDVVLTTAVFDYLEKLGHAYPKTEFKIYFLTKIPSLSLISSCFPRVTCLDVESFASPQHLIERIHSLDFLIDLQVNLRSKRLCQLFRSSTGKPYYAAKKDRIKRTLLVWAAWLRGRTQFLSVQHNIPVKRQFETGIEALMTALNRLGFPERKLQEIKQLSHPKFPRHLAPIDALNQGSRTHWLALAPGASYEAKKYPPELLIRLLQMLKERLPNPLRLGLIFLGDKNDFNVAEKISAALSDQWFILNMCGKTSLAESGHILSQCVASLGNDSSIGHISEAVGTRSGVFFGPTSELFGFSPFRKDSQAFSEPLGCRPCSKHGSKKCRYGDQKCFTEIDQNKVLDWILSALTDSNVQKTPDQSDGQGHDHSPWAKSHE